MLTWLWQQKQLQGLQELRWLQPQSSPSCVFCASCVSYPFCVSCPSSSFSSFHLLLDQNSRNPETNSEVINLIKIRFYFEGILNRQIQAPQKCKEPPTRVLREVKQPVSRPTHKSSRKSLDTDSVQFPTNPKPGFQLQDVNEVSRAGVMG